MCVGIVSAGGVHDFGHGLISHKLESGEGDGHAQGGRVGDIEGGEAFCAKNVSAAMSDTLIYRAVQLHALLDDWNSQRVKGWRLGDHDVPSNGFMSASLEMVAAAPLAAGVY